MRSGAPSASPADTPPRPSPRRSPVPGGPQYGYRLLRGQKVGVVTNPTGITADVRHIVDVMHPDSRVNLTAVFGPEHGFRGTAQAGGSEGRYDDPATGLPVYDTYLKSGQPLADIFTASGVDTVLFDIQDAGARFYTYIWTLYDCMEAAALAGKRLVVLDRPNPVTGRAALGPVLDPAFATGFAERRRREKHEGLRRPGAFDDWHRRTWGGHGVARCADPEVHPSEPLAEVLRRLIAALGSGPGSACPVCADTGIEWRQERERGHEPWSGPVCTACGIAVPQPVLTDRTLARARLVRHRRLAAAAAA
ncbi:hypothetical protein SMICM304S_08887 [Streptomyces microflavus]